VYGKLLLTFQLLIADYREFLVSETAGNILLLISFLTRFATTDKLNSVCIICAHSIRCISRHAVNVPDVKSSCVWVRNITVLNN